MKLLFPFAKRFIAGIDINDSSVIFQNHLDQEFIVIANLVGENTQSIEQINANRNGYFELLSRFKKERFSISVKLSSIGMDYSFEESMNNLTKLSDLASANNQMIRLDMEDSKYTDRTIEACKIIQDQTPGSVGITLQANLHRTKNDIRDLIAHGVSIRLVKGAYLENDGIAYTKLDTIRQKFLDYSSELLVDENVKHSIATHDEKLLDVIVSDERMKNHCFEFLFGVRRDLQQRYKMTHDVGIYMPYGKEWLSYTIRRLKELKNIKFVARNLIKEK